MDKPLVPKITSLPHGRQFDWPLDSVVGKTLSLEGSAIPKHFRSIDCKAFTENGTLRVIEWDIFDPENIIPRYAAISYVWKGIHDAPTTSSFTIHGAVNGGRVDLSVLQIICDAATFQGAQYAWIDQFSIMQTCVDDKHWQIMNMAEVYRRSHICFILPGGLGPLVEMCEQTTWIDRSWTLQEALLPRAVWCIFKWTKGTGQLNLANMRRPFPSIMINDKSAMEELTFLHHSAVRAGTFTPSTEGGTASPAEKLPVLLFSANKRALPTLMDAREDDAEQRSHAIWRSMLIRKATWDVDAVYSIMGLVGIQLDPSRYSTRSDALLALIQAFMSNGGTATWLAASVTETGTLLQGLMSISPDDNDGLYRWYLKGAPAGTVDDTGTFHFVARVSPLKADDYPDSKSVHIRGGRFGTHAVVLGKIQPYFEPVGGTYVILDDCLIMLLEPSPNGDRWEKTGMASILPQLTESWTEQQVQVRG